MKPTTVQRCKRVKETKQQLFSLQLSSFKARLGTFKDWPEELEMKPEELAEAGFFHSPTRQDADQVHLQ